jgi:hypothetical protein
MYEMFEEEYLVGPSEASRTMAEVQNKASGVKGESDQ